MRIHVAAIGVLAPGLSGWEATRHVAAGAAVLALEPLAPPAPRCLPSAERRRANATTRLAIAVAEQAIEAAAIPAGEMAMVFAASEAAPEITHQLCEVLAGTREVSPTVFHNSVHNAPLGYLSIAMGARRSGTSLCRGPWTFATGLVHAAIEARSAARPVLLVTYDSPFPSPMRERMPMVEPTAVALVLTPEPDARTLATCELEVVPGLAADPWPEWIPAGWRANPGARAFVALGALAQPGAASAALPYSPDASLAVRRHG